MGKQSTLVIPGNAALLYDVLTDYERLPEWLPRVSGANLLAREGDIVFAELELSGESAARVSMECIHTKERSVTWLPVEEEVPVSEVHWELSPAEGGACSVSMRLERPVSLNRFSSVWRDLMEPEACLEALKRHAAMFLSDSILAEAGCRGILEIIETDQGLICWLQGKKYRLVPEPE